MKSSEELEAMAEACLKAHESVANSGTPEMLVLMQIVLFQVGHEIARRESELRDALDRA